MNNYIIYPLLLYMEFDLKNILSENIIIEYNYENTTFYKTQFEKTLENGGYIKIPFASKSNSPNIVSKNLFNGKYITKNLYIIKKIHYIKNTIFDGELVIEHKSLTNNEKSLYICFLLQSSEKNAKTNLDIFIKGETDVSLDINTYITDETCIFYETNKENVIIFPTPITVNSNFNNYKSENILGSPSDKYYMVNIKPALGNINKGNIGKRNIEGFKEGVDGEYIDVATYCQPIDEEDPTMGVKSDVIIPADGQVSINKATTSQLNIAVNFFGFFILVLFVGLVIPKMYHYFIVILVLDNKYIYEDTITAQKMLNRLGAIDIFLCFLLFMLSFSMINNGIINDIPMNTIIGFYIFIFFLTSFIFIQAHRLINESQFLELFKVNNILPTFADMDPDWGGFIYDNIMILKQYKLLFTFAFVYGILYFLLYISNMSKLSGTSFFTSIQFYMIFISIYICIYIHHILQVNIRG